MLCLFNNVRGIDEKEEISISLFVQVENQARHDECLAAAGCHVEQKMQGFFLARKFVVKAMEESREGLLLIGAQVKRGV